MNVGSIAAASASLAQVYADAAKAASAVKPLNTSERAVKNVAVEVSMFALKETLEMAGQVVDILV